MALEEILTKLTASLDANTAALKAAGGKAAVTTSAPTPLAPTKKAAVDFDTVKALASKVMEGKGRPFAKKLIKDVGGAADLATVKPDKYPALMKAFETAMAEPEATAEVEEDEEL
jgi:hypothetical protein